MKFENASARGVGRVLGRNRLALAVAATIAGMLAGASGANAQFTAPNNNGFLNNNQFFDWQEPTGNSNFIQAPFLDDSPGSIAAVKAYFNSVGGTPTNPAKPLAVKIMGPINASTASQIFGAYKVSFVFGDYESSGFNNAAGTPAGYAAIDAQYANLVNQVTGGGTTPSKSALISGFALAPMALDKTSANSANAPTATNFNNSKMNVAAEVLYPGDASFRTPSQLGGPSNGAAPNIRSNLFTLPISRLSNVSNNIAPGMAHVPYISRFNDFNNPAFATGGQTAGGVNQFNANSGVGAHQLLSRDDFAALVLHYRMRGATSFHLLDPGVQGYTVAQMESDALTGWNNSSVASYFADSTAKPLTLSTTIFTDGVAKTLENAGVVYSGVVTGIVNNVVNPNAAIAMLISNLDDVAHNVTFPGSVASGTIAGSYNVLAHSHSLLQFTRVGSMWQLASNTPIFNDGTLASSDGVGVPEPASVGLLGLAGFGILIRRRRKA